MRELSASDVLEVWERTERASPTFQALAFLAAAEPEVGWSEHENLELGRRDRLLLAVRRGLLGDWLCGRASCPACSAEVEFEAASSLLEGEPVEDSSDRDLELSQDGLRVRFRSLTSADLLALEGAAPEVDRRRLLAERCVFEAKRSGQEVAAAELEDEHIGALAAALERADPNAERSVELTCPECENQWLDLFDPASFFAEEIEALVRRLLAEVDLLARAYGWSERRILAMSARRRRAYLEMVEA